jgi:hypothetical protein
LEDDEIDKSSSKEEEEVEPPPCGPLQATLLDSVESAHRESTTWAVCAIVLEQTNVAITNRVAKNLVEFAKKDAAGKKLMATEQRATRELKEKSAHNPPGKHTGEGLGRRPKQQRQRIGLPWHWLGGTRQTSCGPSSTLATTRHLAGAQDIKGPRSQSFIGVGLRSALILPKKARKSDRCSS